MKAVDMVVGMCPECDEGKMMKKGMEKMPAASKCDGCGMPLKWKK